MSEPKVIGLTEKRPVDNNFETLSDEAVLGKTMYYDTMLEVSVCPKNSVKNVAHFTADRMRCIGAKYDENDNPIDTRIFLHNPKSKDFDKLPEEYKKLFTREEKYGQEVITFWMSDMFYVAANIIRSVSEEETLGSIKVEYKKVQEVE
jgi:hypothetical protein